MTLYFDDRDIVKAGDTIYVTYDNLYNVPGVVRKVMDRRQGLLSARIAFRDIPENKRLSWSPDPEAPECTPIVLRHGEWTLSRRS